jgi:hypothetical protein
MRQRSGKRVGGSDGGLGVGRALNGNPGVQSVQWRVFSFFNRIITFH